MDAPFQIIRPTANQVPVVISVPHCGTAIPDDIRACYKEDKINFIVDTDFFVDQLYNFATDLGITIIKAHYSRWVIDLNRSPNNENLYKDGRIITSLTPTTNFNGSSIYKEKENEPDAFEIENRLLKYYRPYHNEISTILNSFIKEYGIAMLWDAHSIKRVVPSISNQPFPDLVLGSNDRQSATNDLIDCAIKELSSGDYSLEHNHPFKGGYITRSFGNPENGIHALQLEMSKDCYMNDSETNYHPDRARKVQKLLETTLLSIIDKL